MTSRQPVELAIEASRSLRSVIARLVRPSEPVLRQCEAELGDAIATVRQFQQQLERGPATAEVAEAVVALRRDVALTARMMRQALEFHIGIAVAGRGESGGYTADGLPAAPQPAGRWLVEG
ncbi:MAG: hypothetical protein ACRD96_11245 [Bryobacteraceae bacterium]